MLSGCNMIEIPISPEVREAVAKAIYERWRSALMQGPPWEEVGEDWRTGTLGQAEAAIVALFEAWPGMDIMPFGDGVTRIRLPLP